MALCIHSLRRGISYSKRARSTCSFAFLSLAISEKIFSTNPTLSRHSIFRPFSKLKCCFGLRFPFTRRTSTGLLTIKFIIILNLPLPTNVKASGFFLWMISYKTWKPADLAKSSNSVRSSVSVIIAALGFVAPLTLSPNVEFVIFRFGVETPPYPNILGHPGYQDLIQIGYYRIEKMSTHHLILLACKSGVKMYGYLRI